MKEEQFSRGKIVCVKRRINKGIPKKFYRITKTEFLKIFIKGLKLKIKAKYITCSSCESPSMWDAWELHNL